ncbi:MAG: DUF3365 domain-containing protein, partial [Proteobacteria bacterium]|nr:DUF3365 domain-containing protein [Pseudomonadota bacterium]
MRKIATKLLIAIGATTILLSVFLLYQAYTLTNRHIREAVEQNAAMALKFDVAIRDYIAQYVRPVMYELLGKDEFIPELMSTSYVARTIFEDVRKDFPDFIIKFASDNPRNPANQAGLEELKIIEYFNDNPQLQRWEGEISINDKPYFAAFSAMRMEVACMRCHSDPENAPASLLKRYGPTAGFHRPLGQVIGMDIVAIPIVKITEQLWAELMQAFFLIVLSLLLFFLSIIYLTRFIVTNRLSSITQHFLTAAQQSNYQEITLIEIEGNDEIRDLAVSFNSLCDRLKNFYSSLETQVKDRTRELADKNEQMKQEIEERKRAEEVILREKLLSDSIVDNTPAGIAFLDNDFVLRKCNHMYGELLRLYTPYTPEQALGMCYFDYATGSRPQVEEWFQKVRDSGQVDTRYGFELVLKREGRDLITYWDTSVAPMLNPAGKVEGILILTQDVTERRQAEETLRESEERFRHLYEQAPLGYHSLDKEGCIIDANQAWLDLMGYSRDQVIGRWFGDFLAPHEVDGFKQNFPRFIDTGEVHVDLQMVQQVGSTIIVHVDGSIGYDEGRQFKQTHCILHDITERKRFEEELLRAQKLES